MLQDYEERRVSPIRIGLIGALTVAAVVAGLLWYREHSESKATIGSMQLEIEKLEDENAHLKETLSKLEEDSKDTASTLQKKLQQRESQFSSLKRTKESDDRAAGTQIAQLKKEKTDLETKSTQLKKDSETNLKRVQEQLMKIQVDLQKARSDSERHARNYQTLKAKLENIEAGDQAAADHMVEELAQARQALKREQTARRRLEEELTALRSQPPPQ
jgi:chromosome segregation ATPase